ncbi:MAG: STAS domain-containing protein [Bacillota bacterium]|jgi:stage II sporulation protein AA (anti-sigma F factor antagonist)|nr:MAG: STAS domain-containing protein [Bacillota bacterium]
MDIASRKDGMALLVSVSGELDLHTAREFRARVDADYDRFGARDMVFDFARVSFVDSSGLGAILGRYSRAAEKGGQVALAGPQPHVRRLLELAGVMRIIHTYADVEEALRAMGAKEAAAGGDKR